jgi:hypothetical protein
VEVVIAFSVTPLFARAFITQSVVPDIHNNAVRVSERQGPGLRICRGDGWRFGHMFSRPQHAGHVTRPQKDEVLQLQLYGIERGFGAETYAGAINIKQPFWAQYARRNALRLHTQRFQQDRESQL